MNCWHMALAMSRVMEKVVVVVVVTMREDSRGSGPRFDWENFSEARFLAASSLGIQREDGIIDRRQSGHVRGEGVGKTAEILPVRGKLQGDDERCKQVQRVLEGIGIALSYG